MDRQRERWTDGQTRKDRQTDGWIRKGTPEITLEESSYLMEERNGSIGLNIDIDNDDVGKFDENIYFR
jgi:hypothetical protein